MKRFNKEINLDKLSSFLIKVGTVNKNNPNVFYINGSSWVKPLDNTDFEEKINNIIYNFKRDILLSLNTQENISNKFILNFEAKTNAMKKNKKTFITFEIYCKQKDNTNKLNNIIDIHNNINNNIINLMNLLHLYFVQNNFIFI